MKTPLTYTLPFPFLYSKDELTLVMHELGFDGNWASTKRTWHMDFNSSRLVWWKATGRIRFRGKLYMKMAATVERAFSPPEPQIQALDDGRNTRTNSEVFLDKSIAIDEGNSIVFSPITSFGQVEDSANAIASDTSSAFDRATS